MKASAKLYIVATPIGNISDLSLRAIDTLKHVDVILCEDTRHSRKLLSLMGITNTKLESYHQHNEQKKSEQLTQRMIQGTSFALICDSGTPSISDPGYILVDHCLTQGIEVVSLPGPCAVIAALSISGVAALPFSFHGFLPTKSTQRRSLLTTLLSREETLVFYEAPHRLLQALDDIEACVGDHTMVVAKELTKQFERIMRGSVQTIKSWIDQDPNLIRGEFVLIIPPFANGCPELDTISQKLAITLLPELGVAKTATVLAKATSLRKKMLYDWLLTLKD